MPDGGMIEGNNGQMAVISIIFWILGNIKYSYVFK